MFLLGLPGRFRASVVRLDLAASNFVLGGKLAGREFEERRGLGRFQSRKGSRGDTASVSCTNMSTDSTPRGRRSWDRSGPGTEFRQILTLVAAGSVKSMNGKKPALDTRAWTYDHVAAGDGNEERCEPNNSFFRVALRGGVRLFNSWQSVELVVFQGGRLPSGPTCWESRVGRQRGAVETSAQFRRVTRTTLLP